MAVSKRGGPPCVPGSLPSPAALVQPVDVMGIGGLWGDESLRSGEVDDAVVTRLIAVVASGGALAPLVVHEATGWVVDGRHRLAAARRAGLPKLAALLLSGSTDDAFLEGVRVNHETGRPLSVRDRRRAVVRLVSTHPHLSYRDLAAVTGASMGVIGSIRCPERGNRGSARTDPARDLSAAVVEGLLNRLQRDPSMLRTHDQRQFLRGLADVVCALQTGTEISGHQLDCIRALLTWGISRLS